jgi:hypothetical protein
MNSFRQGQRVIVRAAYTVSGSKIVFPRGALGTVARLLVSSEAAWVDLDEPSGVEALHRFPDAARARWVRTYPDDCEAAIVKNVG